MVKTTQHPSNREPPAPAILDIGRQRPVKYSVEAGPMPPAAGTDFGRQATMPQFIPNTPLWEAIWAAGVFVVAIVVGWFVIVVVGRFRRRLERRRQHLLVSQLLGSLSRPIFLLVISQGILAALAAPTALDSWDSVLGRISVAAAIAIGVYGIGRVAGGLLEWYSRSPAVRKRSRIDLSLARLLRRLLLLVIYVVGGLMLLDYVGVNITAAVAGLGIGGIAVALALQPTLANFFAGTQLVSDRVIRVGDYIELDDGTKGYVTIVGWRSTRIRTPYNNLVIIPNSRIANSIITNYQGPTMELAVIVNCGVSYDSDLNQVEEVALDVARQLVADLDEAVKSFEPWFGFERFGDSNIDFWVWLQATDRIASFKVQSELIKRLHARLKKEGITINYPVRHLVYDKPPNPPLPSQPPN